MPDAKPVREKPIRFKDWEVRATLEGRKTQTRRILKRPTDHFHASYTHAEEFVGKLLWWDGNDRRNGRMAHMPYAPGDRLWVREAWRSIAIYDVLSPSEMGGEESIQYECDETWQTWGWVFKDTIDRLLPPTHMPRWASRITLEVTDVRVQRLQDISEEDAEAEGARGSASGPWGREGLIEDYSDIWEAIHGPGSWDANPWVAAITFKIANQEPTP